MKKAGTFLIMMIWTGYMIAQPCTSSGHQQFDFWVGDWEVYDTQADTLVGHNTVRKILNGCVIEEHWTGVGGSEGKSFNTYNEVDSTWNQVWVDGNGNTYHFKGSYSDGHMTMSGETKKQGNLIQFTMDYYFDEEKGTVRQVWKRSLDYGENWASIFDGIYRKTRDRSN